MAKNQIDGSGIQIQTFKEIVTDIVEGTSDVSGLKQIYGSDINIDSNTPDGQMINLFALSKKDILDLLVQIYNSKDPDQAVGIELDALCQLCGIQRKGGTYTEVEIVVNVDRSLNLNGQDTSTPFTVKDANGNLFQLIESASLVSGNNTLEFKAVEIGFIQVLANTITTPETVILGVQTVNNPDVAYKIGEDQETDADLRIRRQKSVALASQGIAPSMIAGLNAIDGLLEAVVHENVTGSTDVDGIPGHAIWVIVDGGSDAEVADMIYTYRNAGCGMKGGTSVDVTQVDGTTFEILFDRAIYQDLRVFFHLTSIISGVIDNDAIKEGLAAKLSLGIYDPADVTTITSLIHEIDPNVIVSYCSVSGDGATWADSVYPTSKKHKFVLTEANIGIVSSDGSSSSSSSSKSSSSSSSSCRSSSSSSCSKSSSCSSSSSSN